VHGLQRTRKKDLPPGCLNLLSFISFWAPGNRYFSPTPLEGLFQNCLFLRKAARCRFTFFFGRGCPFFFSFFSFEILKKRFCFCRQFFRLFLFLHKKKIPPKF